MKKDILKRVLCLACCLSLTLGMFAYKPAKAQAVVVDATAAFGAAAATAAINGTTASTLFTGMTTSAATNGIILYMDSYAAATGAAASGTALASTIGAGTVITAAGTLVLGAAAGIALIKFIDWLREDKGIEAGGAVVPLFSDSGYYVGDYKVFRQDISGNKYITHVGQLFNAGDTVVFSGHTFATEPLSNGYMYYTIDGTRYSVSPSLAPSGASLAGRWGLVYRPGDNAALLCELVGGGSTRGDVNPYPCIVPNSSRFNPLLSSVTYVDKEGNLQPNEELQELPETLADDETMVISPGILNLPQDDPQAAADAIMQPIIDGTLNPTVTIEADPTVTPDPDPNPDPDGSTGADPDTTTGWLSRILESIKSLPQQIAEAVGNIISSIFAPDAELVNEITGTFSEKFGFVETLKTIGDDLFGMTPSTEPPVVWIHLEDAEGKYAYGGTVKALDMSWYQRYKADMDRILGGFLWLAYLWLLFRRLPDILGGAGLVIADGMYIDTIHGPSGEGFMFRRSKRL